MNAWTPPPAEASPDDAADCAAGERARLDGHLRMLDRLAETGMEIVEAIRRHVAEAPPANAPPPNDPLHLGDLALAYARASRAVRMSIALSSRLRHERGERAVAAATAARVSAVRDRPARRARIERIVERLAKAESDDEGVEQCRAEAAERLNDVDVFGDVLSRPVSETIALICRELGLSPDWPALAQEAWAREEIAGGDVGAPLKSVVLSAAKPPGPAAGWSEDKRRAGAQPRPPAPVPHPSPHGLSRGASCPPPVRGP